MMNGIRTLILLAFLFPLCLVAQWSGNTSPTYPELIAYYEELDRKHKEIELYEMGPSDYGLPIYVCIVNGAQDSVRTFEKARNSTTILINNAIHAGEPDGVNASVLWIENWIKSGKKTKGAPVVAIIPAYNVGGMMNRNSTSRANQNGPEEYGFRGNARNLDLNRDFIKLDSRNAFTFAKIYHGLDPDVFVDTHVSNGADYQYTLTYIASMKERLAPGIRTLTYDRMLPKISAALKEKGTDLFPYVELMKEVPEEGIHAFNDLPRYAMGYAALFDAVSITIETHMLKPFPERVKATYLMLDEMIRWMSSSSDEIEKLRLEAKDYRRAQELFTYNYFLTEKKDSILFKGFEAEYPKSAVTGLPRLMYNRSRPYEKYIPFFQTYSYRDSVLIPELFILGGQEGRILERLDANGVKYNRVERDTIMVLHFDRVRTFKSYSKPYEGHFYHSEMLTDLGVDTLVVKRGDILIPTDQPHKLFIMSVLTPEAEDSYVRWNFTDSYLQQKEYFSHYVFEEKAAEILKEKPWLREELEVLREGSAEFRQSQWEQLYFIYRNSSYFEESFYRLPIFMKY